MNRLNITAKIWLSIGVFVLGFVLSTILGQVQGLNTERTLGTTSASLFPAAQKSQEVESAFERMVKGFSDAVMTQDASGVSRAGEEGRAAAEGLKSISRIPKLPKGRSEQAGSAASAIEQLVGDASSTYGTLLANPASMTPEMQEKMRGLAARTDEIKASLKTVKEQCARDLHEQLASIQKSSAYQRWIALGVFAATLLLAAVIVNLTIRRAITGPIVRVIHGVQNAADDSARSSEQITESGQVVARDAQEQAACIEETSASLEEISATTQQNAGRATKADSLMREARQTVDRAAQAMHDLTNSMDVISKSSNQVAAVLKSIDEIAFHTNILALNAAVEAARAGDAGAGFSVVADEVRALAQRAAEAARNSANMVEKTITDVNQGVQFVGVAREAFTQVSTTISSGSGVVSEIAASSEEQARGIKHIGEAITRIENVMQNNVRNAQRTAEAASAMSNQVQATRNHLDELVAVVGLHRD